MAMSIVLDKELDNKGDNDIYRDLILAWLLDMFLILGDSQHTLHQPQFWGVAQLGYKTPNLQNDVGELYEDQSLLRLLQ